MIRSYIALGSNLGNPLQQLQTALIALNKIPHTTYLKVSRFYRSTPLTGNDQPDYINAVTAIETALCAHELLNNLQQIEKDHGRVTVKRWGPRTLDLDLLLYGDHIINTTRLLVPHPGLYKRNFVLFPLADIEPTLIFPNGKNLQDILAKTDRTGLTEI